LAKTTPRDLLVALEDAFPQDPTMPWLDIPAVLFALAMVEDGTLELSKQGDYNASTQEYDAIGLWQINKTSWPFEFAAIAADNSLASQVSAMKPLVSVLKATIRNAHLGLLRRVRAGERKIKFNAVFDAPLWASIAWQYSLNQSGYGFVTEWTETRGSKMGEIGFKDWAKKHKVTILPGYEARQIHLRAAYSMALSMEKESGYTGWEGVIAGLLKETKDTGIDYVSATKDGFKRLFEIPFAIAKVQGEALEALKAKGLEIEDDIKAVIGAAKGTGTGIADLNGATRQDLATAINGSIKAYDDSVEPLGRISPQVKMALEIAGIAVGVYFLFKIVAPSRRMTYA
jgi:hypothetical protein